MVDYHEYILSAEWRLRADAAIRAAAYRCRICNRHEDEAILDVHHRTYDRLGQELPEDLTVLCRDCHELYSRYSRLARHGSPEIRNTRRGSLVGNVAERVATEGINSLATGFSDIDRCLLGLAPGELYVVASTPSMGKTQFVVDVSSYVSLETHAPVAVFSQQTTTEHFTRRLMIRINGYHSSSFSSWAKTESEGNIREKFMKYISNIPLCVDDSPKLTPSLLLVSCMELLTRDRLKLCIIDGVELMQADDPRHNLSYQQTEIARALKQLAQGLKIPVVATVQLDVSQRAHKRPRLSDFEKRGSWDHFADAVLFIYRDELFNPETTERPNIAEIDVAKNRDGSTGIMDLYWGPEGQGFSNLVRKEIKL